MARMMFDEREKYTEHWEIAINNSNNTFTITHNKAPHIDGYDRIQILSLENKINIIVHTLKRLDSIFTQAEQLICPIMRGKIALELGNI